MEHEQSFEWAHERAWLRQPRPHVHPVERRARGTVGLPKCARRGDAAGRPHAVHVLPFGAVARRHRRCQLERRGALEVRATSLRRLPLRHRPRFDRNRGALSAADRSGSNGGARQLELVAFEPVLRSALLLLRCARVVPAHEDVERDCERLQWLEFGRGRKQEKSVSTQLGYAGAKVVAAVLYLGGVERRAGALEGRAFRHLFDTHATWTASSWLSLAAQANGGFERNLFGVSHWEGGAVYARITFTPTFAVALRGDALAEHRAESPPGRAESIFFGVPWVSSRTATLDYHPASRVSFRMEFRHDDAAENLFFGDAVQGNGAELPFVPNRRAQNTLTLGVTGGF